MMAIDYALVIGILLLGVALVAAEVFVIPGVGVAGVLGLGVIALGVVLAFMKFGALGGVTALFAALLALVTAWIVFVKSGASRRFVLDSAVAKPVFHRDGQLRLLGRQGVTVTPMRPSGVVAFGDEHIDAVTDGSYLEAGVAVTVVQIEGSRVVVEGPPATAA